MSQLPEFYDPNKPVCANQDDFNQAFRNALRYTENQEIKRLGVFLYLSLIFWIMCSVWGIILALRLPRGPERTMHLTFAIVFGPAYLLAYYLMVSN